MALLPSSLDKCRLRAGFDAAALSGGYRDVQLSAVFRSDAAIASQLDTHVCEIQLHLRAIYERKSDGGHKSYVVARNLRGD